MQRWGDGLQNVTPGASGLGGNSRVKIDDAHLDGNLGEKPLQQNNILGRTGTVQPVAWQRWMLMTGAAGAPGSSYARRSRAGNRVGASGYGAGVASGSPGCCCGPSDLQ